MLKVHLPGEVYSTSIDTLKILNEWSLKELIRKLLKLLRTLLWVHFLEETNNTLE